MTATDVHAHVLLPSLQAEVEARVPELVKEAAALDLKRDVPGLGERMFRHVCNLRSVQIGPHLAILRDDLYCIPLPGGLAYACPCRVVDECDHYVLSAARVDAVEPALS